jgi:hypothetical protein
MVRSDKKKSVDTTPLTMMNAEQACNEFQLLGTTRLHVLKKFANQSNSVNEWTRIFRAQKVID